MTVDCPRCDAQWGGNSTAHCGACHHTFTGVTAFDKHRVRYKCVDPASVDLVDVGRKYPCFGSPSDTDWFANLKEDD